MADHSLALVEFQAPWCGHCQKLAPELKKAAASLHASAVGVATVDATLEANKPLAAEQGVASYPTLKVLNTRYGSGVTDYKGGRTHRAIVEALQAEDKPLVRAIADPADVGSGLPAFVYVGEPSSALKAIAHSRKAQANFYALGAQPDSEQKPGRLQFADGGRLVEQDADMAAFVNKHSFPLVAQLTPENENTFFERGLDLMWFGLAADDAESVEAIREGVRDFAGQQTFVWLDFASLGPFLTKNFGCDRPKCATLTKGQAKWRLTDNVSGFSAAAISRFLEQDRAGRLKRWFRSQEAPAGAGAEDEGVAVLVSSNFEASVRGRDAFVFFYAPWCGHCQSSKPEFEQLRAALQNEHELEHVLVAKFDATENDVPHPKIELKSYPTFYLFKADD